MPIYEYQCSACGARTEKFQKISDEPLTRCPHCGQDSLEKLVSAAAFQLKGSGWYQTDFKDSKPKTTDKGKTDTNKKPAKQSDNSSNTASKTGS